MRVQYTLPGFIPAETPPSESIAGGSPFRSRLTFLPPPRSLNWERLLRLDQLPVDAASIGPPPRPSTIDVRDVASERLTWRQMLDRHLVMFESTSSESALMDRSTASHESRAIERMLALLIRFRELEDSIAARHLSEPED
jgi:hypothetical protein